MPSPIDAPAISLPCAALLLAALAATAACYSPSPSHGDGGSDDSTTNTTPGTTTATTATTTATTATTTAGTNTAGTSDDTSATTIADTTTAADASEGSTTDADTTAPSIVAITPGDGDNGVRADTNLVVEFDEPMDQDATQAAYQSPEIPAASVVFSWDAEGTTLTIDPNDDLEYAQGVTPAAVVALAYQFSLTSTATDLAGNALANPAMVTFTTLRQLTPSFPAVDAMTGDMAFNGTTLGIEVCVGDQYFMAGTNGWVHGGITFDLSTLPGDIFEFQAATLQGDQVALNGAPYSALGNLRAEHVVFAALTDLWNAELLEDIGEFSTSPTLDTRTMDVLTQVEADYANGAVQNDRSQYRLAFEQLTDNDGAADYACFSKAPETLFLALDYLIP